MNLVDHLRGELVYGEPFRSGDADVITVSRVRGDRVSPVGVYVIRPDRTEWLPAIDGNLLSIVGVTTGLIAATLGCIAVVRRPPWPDLFGTIESVKHR